jgi:CBS domain containing-hemolysin-like protein
MGYFVTLAVLLVVLALAAYIDRVYSEMGKFLAREYQDNIDTWEQVIEPKLRLGRESIALSASVLRQLSLAAMALLWGLNLYTRDNALLESPSPGAVARAAAELILLILIFDRLIPQILFARTRGLWMRPMIFLVQVIFYLILPVTIVLQLLLSIAALAEPEDTTEQEHPSEAMEALLEAGEEEGIFEESDRELVRSVVEFGDKIVREVMTPRPEVFAVPGTLTLREFTTSINEHAFSRVPVYAGSLDHVTGIAFARDLLKVLDIEAGTRTVAQIQRPAAFVPETKNVAELMREMQREKQHMRIVIDEYGGVAGLVTIEDLLETIVGDISDEHDEPEPDDEPVKEAEGIFVVPGNTELSRLRELFAEDFSQLNTRAAEEMENGEEDDEKIEEQEQEMNILRHFDDYESTTIGGLVSEMAGHIPAPGEVVEENGLRVEVLEATDRRVERVRVRLETKVETEAARQEDHTS